jgi:hypothetical protein
MTKRIKPEIFKIAELIDSFKEGSLSIPEFQREYVWKKHKAGALLDSLYRSLSISSFLVWESGDKDQITSQTGRLYHANEVRWLVDGQQRITTLKRIKDGDIEILFNPQFDPSKEKGLQFQCSSPAKEKDPRWHSVQEILNDDDYGNGIVSNDIRTAFNRLRDTMKSYEVPVVVMKGHSLQEAIEAFSRINQKGVRLNSAIIESAYVAATHAGLIADKVLPFVRGLIGAGFDRLSAGHLFKACSFIASPDGRNKTGLHEMDEKTVRSAWERTEEATNHVIDFIKTEFGLADMKLQWSVNLLIPAIVLFERWTREKLLSKTNKDELAGWIALAAVHHRYSASSDTALQKDMVACRQKDAIRDLLKNAKGNRATLLTNPKDFSGNVQDKGALFANYLACRHRGMFDFLSGISEKQEVKITIAQNVDKHHVMPRKYANKYAPDNPRQFDTIANFVFIRCSTNMSIGDDSPSVYLPKISAKTRKSQCIPEEIDLYSLDNTSEFWRVRRQLLSDAFNEYVKSKLSSRRL